MTRLVALQAQYAPSPYVALWSRIEGFRKEQLTRALTGGQIVKAGSLRTTLHVMSASSFPISSPPRSSRERGRTEGLGVDVEALRAALSGEPITSAELFELGHRVLGTDDRWTVAFALSRAAVRAHGAGRRRGRTRKPSPFALWREPLPDAQKQRDPRRAAVPRGVRPGDPDDIEQFTVVQAAADRPGARGAADVRDGEADALRHSARAACRGRHAGAGAVPAGFDSIILAHRDRSRIVPPEYVDAVFNKRNATTKNTFTVDGFVAGAWRIEHKRLVARAVRAAAVACAPRGRCRRRAAARLVSRLDREERQFGLALAAQDREVDLGPRQSALLGERDRLRLDLLRDEDAAAGRAGGVDADAVEVPRQLLDRVDRADCA